MNDQEFHNPKEQDDADGTQFPLNVIPAEPVQRLSAFVIDYCLLALFCSILPPSIKELLFSYLTPGTYSLSPAALFSSEPLTVAATFVSLSCLLIIYCLTFELSPLAATPGKFLTGIKVLSISGAIASFERVAIRNLSRIFCLGTLYLGYFLIFTNLERQGLHDMLGRTIIVKSQFVSETQRSLAGLLAFFLFIIICFALPLSETSTNYSEVPSQSNTITTVDPAQTAIVPAASNDLVVTKATNAPSNSSLEGALKLEPFPSDEPGYLKLETGQVKFKSAYTRKDTIRKGFGSSSDVFTQDFQLLRIALFKQRLSDGDITKLDRAGDFFKGAKEAIGQSAVALINITYQNETNICSNDAISALELELNPEFLPRLDTKSKERLIVDLDGEALYNDGRFYAECNKLTAGSTLEFALQILAQPSTNVPPVFINLKFDEFIRKPNIGSRSRYTGGSEALAMWNKDTETLKVAIYKHALERNTKLDIFSSGSFVNSLPRPDVLISFEIPNTKNIIVRDQISSYKLTLFNQSSGPLAFKDDRPSVNKSFSKPSLPAQLAGRIKNGERIIGRLEGKTNISYSGVKESLEWAIPFNAQLYIIP